MHDDTMISHHILIYVIEKIYVSTVSTSKYGNTHQLIKDQTGMVANGMLCMVGEFSVSQVRKCKCFPN